MRTAEVEGQTPQPPRQEDSHNESLRQPIDSESPYLLPDEAAAFMRRKPKTLANWRTAGIGPAFYQDHRGGPVLYKRADLIEHIESSRRTSTSQTA